LAAPRRPTDPIPGGAPSPSSAPPKPDWKLLVGAAPAAFGGRR